MAEETSEVYYDIEAARNVLEALYTCDASSLISQDNILQVKKDALLCEDQFQALLKVGEAFQKKEKRVKKIN